MASKRPIKSMAWRGGKLIRKGYAATLRGAITNNVKRMMQNKIAVVEILDRNEYELALIRHISIHGSIAVHLSRKGRTTMKKEARTARR